MILDQYIYANVLRPRVFVKAPFLSLFLSLTLLKKKKKKRESDFRILHRLYERVHVVSHTYNHLREANFCTTPTKKSELKSRKILDF